MLSLPIQTVAPTREIIHHACANHHPIRQVDPAESPDPHAGRSPIWASEDSRTHTTSHFHHGALVQAQQAAPDPSSQTTLNLHLRHAGRLSDDPGDRWPQLCRWLNEDTRIEYWSPASIGASKSQQGSGRSGAGYHRDVNKHDP